MRMRLVVAVTCVCDRCGKVSMMIQVRCFTLRVTDMKKSKIILLHFSFVLNVLMPPKLKV